MADALYIKIEIATNDTIIQVNVEQTARDGTHQWEMEIRKEDESMANKIRLNAASKLLDALESIQPLSKRTILPPT